MQKILIKPYDFADTFGDDDFSIVKEHFPGYSTNIFKSTVHAGEKGGHVSPDNEFHIADP